MEFKKPINFESFISLIEARSLFERRRKWKIICLLTDLENFSDIEKRLISFKYDLKRFGEVLSITLILKTKRTIYKKAKFQGYILKHNNLYYFFSRENKDDIETHFVKHFLNKVKHIYYLWIPKEMIEKIIEEFENKFKNNLIISEFHSERDSTEFCRAHFRENLKRKITYTGRDGLRSLKELNYYYGVRPYLVDFDISNKCRFRINKDGFFTYYFGDLKFLIKVIEKIYMSSRNILELTIASNYEEVPIKNLKINTINLQPMIVKFKNYELDRDNLENFILDSKNFGFEVFNQSIKTGSLKFNCDIIDTKKKAIFTISSGGHDLVITPQYKTTFDTIFRFLEFLSENLDSAIVYETYKHPIIIE